MSIKIDLKILLFLLLFCLTSQIEIYLLLMLFSLIHELGHLYTGVLMGFKAQEIKITPVGMKIEFEAECKEYNQKILKGNTLGIKRGIVATAGPLTNFIIILITIIVINLNPTLKQINTFNINYQTILYSNFLIGIFNLIPMYPLDGGRIVKELLHIFIGRKKSYQYTYQISKITIIILTAIASIAIIYIQNISIIVILIYLWALMLTERKKYNTRKKIESYMLKV